MILGIDFPKRWWIKYQRIYGERNARTDSSRFTVLRQFDFRARLFVWLTDHGETWENEISVAKLHKLRNKKKNAHFFAKMSKNRAIIPIFSSCICCTRAIFSCSSFRFSFKNSIISEADDLLYLRFFFFFGGPLVRDEPSSSVETSSVVSTLAFKLNVETVAGGIIFGSLAKNSASSSWKSHSLLSLLVFALCSLTFLNFSSSFFHLFAHCSPVTLTVQVELKLSATLCHATFFSLSLSLSKRGCHFRVSKT